MSFDKVKPLHIVADDGKTSSHMMLDKENDWSMDSVGIWFHWEKMYKFIPYTSIIEMWQFVKPEYSTGKSY